MAPAKTRKPSVRLDPSTTATIDAIRAAAADAALSLGLAAPTRSQVVASCVALALPLLVERYRKLDVDIIVPDVEAEHDDDDDDQADEAPAPKAAKGKRKSKGGK